MFFGDEVKRIKFSLSEIYREKALLAMISTNRGNPLIHSARILTRDDMDRVLLKPASLQ